MFFAQPANSFGSLICQELDSEYGSRRKWQRFEFATAWVNQPGAERIKGSARAFLAEGGCIRATVGLDFSSTSYEGLCNLLDLEGESADITTHVFFDENRACTFHPKVFLFSNAKQARLFVGSNNMTGAGLDTNMEAALGVTGAVDDETMLAASQTLAAWRDERSDSRSQRLTHAFLEQLLDQGYVRTEEQLRNRRRSEAGARPSRGEPIFGRSQTRSARRGSRSGGGEFDGGHATDGGQAASPSSGEVLLMRVRPRRNGNQVQISMRVHETSFMDSAEEVVSPDGTRREIGFNIARGKKNTARFEAPELEGMRNPVARFQWVDVGDAGSGGDKVLKVELLDADNGAEGARIFERLEEGIEDPPVTNLGQLNREMTVVSKSDLESAQWYRLDSV